MRNYLHRFDYNLLWSQKAAYRKALRIIFDLHAPCVAPRNSERHIATRYTTSILVVSIFLGSVPFPALSEPIGEHVAKSALLAAGVAAPAMVRQGAAPRGNVPRNGQKRAPASKRNATVKKPVDYMQRGLYFKKQGDLNRALVEFLKASQHNPRLLKAFYEQAVIFRQRGMRKLAESALEQGLAVANNLVESGNANATGKKGTTSSAPSAEECQQLRLLLATIRLEQGNFGGAVQELTKTLGLEVQPAGEEKDSPRTVLQSIHSSVSGAIDGTVNDAKSKTESNSSKTESDANIKPDEQPGSARITAQGADSRGKQADANAMPQNSSRGGMLSQLFSFHWDGLAGIPDLNFLIRKKGKLQPTRRKRRTIIDRWFPPSVTDVPDLEAQSRAARTSDGASQEKQDNAPPPVASNAEVKSSKEPIAASNQEPSSKESPGALSSSARPSARDAEPANSHVSEKELADKELANEEVANDVDSAGKTNEVDSKNNECQESETAESSSDDGRIASSLDFAPSGKWRKVEAGNRAGRAGSPFSIPEVFKPGTIASTLTQGAQSLLQSLATKSEGDSPATSSEATRTSEQRTGILPIQPDDDEPTKRLKFLAENGTASLKEGEAFMFSEETGEATLFAGGKVVRRQISVPRDSAEVVAERRPDILIPENLMYNISLLARLMPKQGEVPPSQPDNSTDETKQPAFAAPNMLGQSQAFFAWLKELLGVR